MRWSVTLCDGAWRCAMQRGAVRWSVMLCDGACCCAMGRDALRVACLQLLPVIWGGLAAILFVVVSVAPRRVLSFLSPVAAGRSPSVSRPRLPWPASESSPESL